MRLGRALKHLLATHWSTRRLFSSATLDAIEAAVALAERSHSGQIRLAIETAMPFFLVWNDVRAHDHALDVFSRLRVWDTEHNNGVLIYLQLADRHVQIVADRGFKGRVSLAEWEAMCRLMEQHFKSGRFREGSIAGIEAVGILIARHFPSQANDSNELPDRPTLL